MRAEAITVYLPHHILVGTLRYLRSYGKRGCECTLFWCGKVVEGKKSIITSLLCPQQHATSLGAKVDPSEVARLYLTLHENKEELISQIHSHPSTAFHSSIDDSYPVMHKPGLLSIVVPHYGFVEMREFLSRSAIYEYKDYKVWNKLKSDEVGQRIIRLPKDFESRLFNRTKLLIKYLNYPVQKNLLSKFKRKKVAVTIDGNLLFTHRGQHMLYASINLLVRCSINIDVFLPDDNVTPLIDAPFVHGNLSDDLIKLALRVNPNLLLRVNPASPRARYDVALIIGRSAFAKADHNVYIDALGWLSYVGAEEPKCFFGDSENPIGPLISASRGSAEVFKILLNKIVGSQYRPLDSAIFSALDYKINQTSWDNPSLPKIFLNDVLLVGAGAIGNCVAYSLASLPYGSGKLTVVDPERIDVTNLNRYVLATITELKMYKVDIIKTRLKEKFDVKLFPGAYQNYPHRRKHSLVVTAVDDVRTRWDIQLDFPSVILNGGMYADSFTISRHDDFLNKPCLGCLYPSSIEVRPMKYPAASFVSMFAGALLAGEILKEHVSSLKGYRLNTSFTVASIFAAPKVNETYLVGGLYEKVENCGCHCKSQEIIDMFRKAVGR